MQHIDFSISCRIFYLNSTLPNNRYVHTKYGLFVLAQIERWTEVSEVGVLVKFIFSTLCIVCEPNLVISKGSWEVKKPRFLLPLYIGDMKKCFSWCYKRFWLYIQTNNSFGNSMLACPLKYMTRAAGVILFFFFYSVYSVFLYSCLSYWNFVANRSPFSWENR